MLSSLELISDMRNQGDKNQMFCEGVSLGPIPHRLLFCQDQKSLQIPYFVHNVLVCQDCCNKAPQLLNPSSVCSPPERPVIWRKDVEVRNSCLYLESRHLRRWWGSALVYQLIGVWMPVSFIEQSGQGGEEVK